MARAAREGALLGSAASLFATRGFAAVSVREVAARARLSKPGLYYHIRGKEDLLFRICHYSMTGILAGARAAIRAHREPVARLRAAIRAHLDFHWRHPDNLVVLMGQRGSLSPERRRRIVEMEREYLDLIRAVIRDGQRRGVFRRADPTVAAFSLFAMLNTLDGWYDARGTLAPERLLDEVERLFLGGLGAPGRDRRAGARSAGL